MKQRLTQRSLIITTLMLSLLSVSYSTTPSGRKKFQGFGKPLNKQAPAWAKLTNQEVLKLGNFNWIVVAEPAFSTFNRKGVFTITADATSPEVLNQVFATLETNGHVDAKLYISKESRFLSEDQTPGIRAFRKNRDKALNEREVRALEHGTLEILLADANKKYKILVIKTNTMLPYSSVFIELESGYWDGESETALRNRMIR